MSLRFTRITSHKPTILSKQYELKNGKLAKSVSAQMVRGFAVVREITMFYDFIGELTQLRESDALAYGLPKGTTSAAVVTKDAFDKLSQDAKAETLTRTNEHFHWSDGPSILMIDIDPPSEAESVSQRQALDVLIAACPKLREIPKIWMPSSSSYIYTTDGKSLTGLRGQRIYMPVDRGSDIPDISEAIWQRLWASGHGFVKVSKSGALLKNSLIDNAVYQPSRLDFAAGAVTGPGLEQRRGSPEYLQ